MDRSVIFWILVSTSIVSSCRDSVKLDTTKLNSTYFQGEYKTNFLGIEEKIILKADGFYDYSQGKAIKIANAGKWGFESKKNCYILLTTFPNIRSKKIFNNDDKSVNLTLDVNTHIEENFGDLEILVIDSGGGGELYYTFIKQDKKRNKDYLLKTVK